MVGFFLWLVGDVGVEVVSMDPSFGNQGQGESGGGGYVHEPVLATAVTYTIMALSTAGRRTCVSHLAISPHPLPPSQNCPRRTLSPVLTPRPVS